MGIGIGIVGPRTKVNKLAVAPATYNAIDIAVYGVFGFFANATVTSHGGPDIACVPVDAERLGIKAAPEQAIAQVKLPKGRVAIEEKEFDVRG